MKKTVLAIALLTLVSSMGYAETAALGNSEKAQTSGGKQSINPAVSNAREEPDESKSKQKKPLFPNDLKKSAAIDEALPYMEKPVALHRCMSDYDSVRLLNIYAVPGVQLMGLTTLPNSSLFMKYHDLNKCLSMRTIDQWEMPALNALTFRIVYIADDSGETVNIAYLFKKMDDGSWKLGAGPRPTN